MLLIQGCEAANVASIKCDAKVDMFVLEKGSGHRIFSFCNQITECRFKLLMQLKEAPAESASTGKQQAAAEKLPCLDCGLAKVALNSGPAPATSGDPGKE